MDKTSFTDCEWWLWFGTKWEIDFLQDYLGDSLNNSLTQSKTVRTI